MTGTTSMMLKCKNKNYFLGFTSQLVLAGSQPELLLGRGQPTRASMF
jgi:hypothetical protein